MTQKREYQCLPSQVWPPGYIDEQVAAAHRFHQTYGLPAEDPLTPADVDALMSAVAADPSLEQDQIEEISSAATFAVAKYIESKTALTFASFHHLASNLIFIGLRGPAGCLSILGPDLTHYVETRAHGRSVEAFCADLIEQANDHYLNSGHHDFVTLEQARRSERPTGFTYERSDFENGGWAEKYKPDLGTKSRLPSRNIVQVAGVHPPSLTESARREIDLTDILSVMPAEPRNRLVDSNNGTLYAELTEEGSKAADRLAEKVGLLHLVVTSRTLTSQGRVSEFGGLLVAWEDSSDLIEDLP